MDYDAIKTAALRACPGILFDWLPGGSLHGAEYDVLNPTRDDRATGNFRINMTTGKWADFAIGKAGGDLISLWAYLHGGSQSEAAADIERQLGLVDKGIAPVIAPFLENLPENNPSSADVCLCPVPDTAPPAPLPHGQMIWTYTNASGAVLGYVMRRNREGGKKDFRPLTYWESAGWQKKSWPRPAPLYRQDRLAERLDAPVLVVEGEKTCDSAETWFADFAVTTWPGGSSRASHADWSLLSGRRVWLLPDADDPGKKAMMAVAETLRGRVAELYIAELEGLPKGWDVADADWNTPQDAEQWLANLRWVALKEPRPIHQDLRFAEELQRANGQGPKYQAIIDTESEVAPFPIPLLAWIENEIFARVPLQSKRAAHITAKAIMAHVTGRQAVSQSGDPAHLYLALVASSVGDVRPYLTVARALLEQAGLGKSVRQQRLSNPLQVFKLLWRHPSMLYLSNEWGVILQFAKRQPAGSTEQVLTLLSEIWDGQQITADTDELKLSDPGVDGQYIIRAPHLTMLLTLSHDQLAVAMKLSEMGRGALEQIQYWILQDDEFEEADPDTLTTGSFPEDLVAQLRSLAHPVHDSGNLAGLTGPDQLPHQVEARFAEAIKPFYAPLDALPAQRSARSLLSGSRMIARREATNYAFWEDRKSPLITADFMRYSVAEEAERLRRILTRFTALSTEDGKLSAYEKVLDFITSEKAKGAGARALQQYCRPYRNLSDDKREALIKQLIMDGAIVEIQPESAPGARRKSLVYVAKAFVKAVS